MTTTEKKGPPDWLDGEHERELWRKPWKVGRSSSASADFKQKLWEHGLLSPNFTRAEAASKGGDSCGCPAVPVPDGLARKRATYHAFSLERVRHDCGDRPMTPLSWGRSDCHNDCVGGVSNSQHREWWATDWSDGQRAAIGGSRFDAAMQREFAHGGIGTVGVAGGQVRHVDNGSERRWVY